MGSQERFNARSFGRLRGIEAAMARKEQRRSLESFLQTSVIEAASGKTGSELRAEDLARIEFALKSGKLHDGEARTFSKWQFWMSKQPGRRLSDPQRAWLRRRSDALGFAETQPGAQAQRRPGVVIDFGPIPTRPKTAI